MIVKLPIYTRQIEKTKNVKTEGRVREAFTKSR